MKNNFVLIILLLCASCSFFTKNLDLGDTLEITSEPSGATVRDKNGNEIGITPFVVKGDDFKNNYQNKILDLSVNMPGYHPKDLFLAVTGKSSISIKLNKYKEEDYVNIVRQGFSGEVERIVKDVISFHEKIIVKDNQGLDLITGNLLGKYPDISMVRVLSAIKEIKDNNLKKAKAEIDRALVIDPQNEIAKNYLNYIRAKLQ